MANNFGLYVVKSDEHIEDKNIVWRRRNLKYNGDSVFNSVLEDNSNFGAYIKNNEDLVLDSDTVAKDTGQCVNYRSDGVYFGDIMLQGTKCINITKKDYQKLRMGNHVDGYSRYSAYKVYYITDDVENCPEIEYDSAQIKGHEDIVYNSFIEGDLQENPLTEATQFNVDVPSLAMRCFKATLEPREKLILTFFVDTFDYDSVYQGKVDDTFTVIITDNDGNDLWHYLDSNNQMHHHTLYAGEYTIALDVDSTIGDKWFSIKCINKAGCGSIEHFYDFRVVSNQNKRIKDITLKELNDYGITVGENQSAASAHKNKVLFPRLCNALKNGTFDNGVKYDGIRLFNANPNVDITDLDDPNNSVYEFDPRKNINRVQEAQVTYNNGEVFVSKDSDLTNIVLPEGSYYLLYYDSNNGIVKRATNPNSSYCAFVDLNLNQSTDSILEACIYSKIEFGKQIKNTTESYPLDVTVGNAVVINNITKDAPSILEWIRWDGAGVYRNSSNKIRVPWGEEDSRVEAGEKKKLATRQLRIHSLENIIKNKNNLNSEFPEGGGYYYCIYGNDKYTEYEVILPDDFIIDLNGCKLKMINCLGIDQSMRIIYAPGTYGLTVKNGTIQGMYSPHNLRLAFLNTCQTTHSVWEQTGGLIDACATSYFTLDNVHIYGAHGYETMTTGVGNGSLIVPASSDWNVTNLDFGTTSASVDAHVGRMTLDGTLDTTNVIVRDENNNSLITSIHPDYDATLNQQICLITTDWCTINPAGLKMRYGTSSLRTNPVKTETLFCDEFYIGVVLKQRYGGAYPYYFVNFYHTETDNNVTTRVHIKTVKTEQYSAIKIPPNATHYNVTAYAVCNIENKNGTEKISVLKRNNRVKYVNDISISSYYLHTGTEKFTKNFLVDNCVYDDSRTCVLGNCGINYIIRNTVFNRIAATPQYLGLTNMIVDIEEHRAAANNIRFENCVSDYGPRSDDSGCTNCTTFIQVGFSRFMQVVNCTNVTYYGAGCDGYFVDNNFTQYRVHCTAHLNSHYRHVSKRNTVRDESHHEYTSITTPSEYLCCFRPVPSLYPSEDTFTVRNVRTTESPWIAHDLSGRAFKVFGEGGNTYIHDAYTNDTILSLWSLIENYATIDGTDGWIHFICCAAKDGELVRIGYKADGLFYTENGKIIVYVDGVKYTNIITDTNNGPYIVIPTKGYHLVSYRLNDTPVSGSSNKILTPNPALFIQIPDIIKTTYVNGVRQDMTMVDKLGTSSFDFVTHAPIIVKSKLPFLVHIGVSGNKSTSVYVPIGTTSLYNNIYYVDDNNNTKYPWKTGTVLTEIEDDAQTTILTKYVEENVI